MHLDHYHSPQAIQERLDEGSKPSYLGDVVLGAMDGCVTTFALVSGVVGAGYTQDVAVILGLSKLFADGFSMAAGNYQRAKSDQDLIKKARAMEERHIKQVPEGEREEVRQIYQRKGFTGKILEEIVDVITSDEKRWVDTMLVEEIGLPLQTQEPFKSAFFTFLAFVLVGVIPLMPFFFMAYTSSEFLLSGSLTLMAFFGVGVFKGKMVHQNLIKSGLETLFTGGLAAAMAYLIGDALEHLIKGNPLFF